MQKIEKGIIETYSSLVSAMKHMPGTRIEDLFASSSVEELESELAHLKDKFFKRCRSESVRLGNSHCNICSKDGCKHYY